MIIHKNFDYVSFRTNQKKKYSLYSNTVGLFLIDPLQRDLYCLKKKNNRIPVRTGVPGTTRSPDPVTLADQICSIQRERGGHALGHIKNLVRSMKKIVTQISITTGTTIPAPHENFKYLIECWIATDRSHRYVPGLCYCTRIN